jgi:hypothetical protein
MRWMLNKFSTPGSKFYCQGQTRDKTVFLRRNKKSEQVFHVMMNGISVSNVSVLWFEAEQQRCGASKARPSG